MAVLTWDNVGERVYETGVDRGVLYVPNAGGVYDNGVAWNGLTTITESPSGAEATAQYADNIKYLNLVSAEEFGGTIEAFTYPTEFGQCDGSVSPMPGVTLHQQGRKPFGLAYRTRIGNDTLATDFGYKLHLMYGAQAAPSEKAYATINDSPEAITFSWEVTTTPVAVTGAKPVALITVDSTKVTAANLKALEDALYGTAGTNPRLPRPDEVLALFGTTQVVTPTAPTYNGTTKVITIPAVTGIKYTIDGVTKTGTVTLTTGQKVIVKALPLAGYVFPPNTDDDWEFSY